MVETTRKLDWTPIRSGNTYCSPRCGMGCTYDAYIKATNSAMALAKRCEKEIGGVWEKRVHENLGWHWSVVQKKTNIEIQYGGYLARGEYYSIGFCGGTPTQVSTHPSTFCTLKEAYDCQIKLIKEEAEEWNSILKNANQ